MPLCNVLPNEITQTFSINFNHKQNEIERLFTLKRKNDETLNSLAKRMKINLKKVFNKKQSKQNSSKENGHNEITDDSNEEFVINFVYQNNNVDLNTKICDFFKNESELHINGQIYSIVLNYPDIVQLKLPKIILSGYYIYPHLDLSNGNIIDSEFIWYKNTSPLLGDEWIKIHEGFLYYVKEDDLNCRLKVICIPKEGEKIGIPKEIISQALIIQGPSDCPFEKRFSFTESITEMDEFRIVSYNILADLYVNSDQSRDVLYEYCKNEYLDFDYRKCLLTKELLGYHSDIYFLQEVDFLYYNTGLKPIFQLHGMDSYFASKENKSEGLGIFYNLTKFKCLRKESHSYAELLSSLELFEWLKIKINDNPNLSKRFTKLKNIFQIILLQSNHYHNRLLLLCNLHLYSKDGADHIRLLQTFMTLKYLEQIITETKSNVNYSQFQLSVILSGDFNSTPNWGVLKLIKTKSVDHSLEDFQSEKNEIIENFSLEHNLELDSACGLPNYTHYMPHFHGCLDYIFFDHINLKCTNVVPMPDHQNIVEEVALPNKKIPSDHLALICTLKWNLN